MKRKYVYRRKSLTILADQFSVTDGVVSLGADQNEATHTIAVTKKTVNKVFRIQALETLELYNVESTTRVPDSDPLKTADPNLKIRSLSIALMVDTNAPKPLRITAERFPGGAGTVYIELEDNDLDEKSLTANDVFKVVQKVKTNPTTVTATPVSLDTTPEYDSNTKRISFSFVNLNPGPYEITIKNLKDKVGNTLTTPANSPRSFQTPGGRLAGKKISYPEYLGPKGEIMDNFDPGSRVDTRVVRLFYFRDAHRVVEIINRDTKRLNQSGVDQVRQIANNARDTANAATDERKHKESLAIQAAQKTRATQARVDETEDKLNSANQNITKINGQEAQLDQQIQAVPYPHQLDPAHFKETGLDEASFTQNAAGKKESYVDAVNKVITTIRGLMGADIAKRRPALRDLRSTLEKRQAALEKLESNKALAQEQKTFSETQARVHQKELTDLQTQLTQDKADEKATQESAKSADRRELRAKENQFRREVAAGKIDHDTYAEGDKNSIDPVMQVTMTVIGEGVIQLRGPMRGINKIRRMINQIDTPVGQVKVAIHTIQVNGENGDRMEPVYEKIEKEIAHARFLSNQSGQLFRKAVAHVASKYACHGDECDHCPTIPEDCFLNCPEARRHELKYMYSFFGADFMNELCRMKSELLNSDNKLLALNSADTMSLANAMLLASLADHRVRMEIVKKFQSLIKTELPDREVEYYKALTHIRSGNRVVNSILTMRPFQSVLDFRDARKLRYNAKRTFHFPNTVGFFDTDLACNGSLNGMQVATIRLAQSMKAQLVAEMEYKNLVKERSLLEKEEDEIPREYKEKAAALEQGRALHNKKKRELEEKAIRITSHFPTTLQISLNNLKKRKNEIISKAETESAKELLSKRIDAFINELEVWITNLSKASSRQDLAEITFKNIHRYRDSEDEDFGTDVLFRVLQESGVNTRGSERSNFVTNVIAEFTSRIGQQKSMLVSSTDNWYKAKNEAAKLDAQIVQYKEHAESAEADIFTDRLLKQLIDEQEEKSVELLEAMRAHNANVDNYLKRLAIAIEDDVNAQFYNPAFQNIRRVSRTWDVNLGQVETTTILTNNRTFAKVAPEATMEFDLPKREILYKEAIGGGKAIVTELGYLANDPTFIAAASMIAGNPAAGLPATQSPLQQIQGLSHGEQGELGSALQKLIPAPSVYKIETGSGFEIKPVIQPDGHSIVYNFNYMYTTNVREPVRADEKHLGRVKRHFVHTDVQTSNYELREVSRYTVALKVSRTSRGVPLLEDIPLLGAIFRPLPSDESSLQSNIILAGSTIYPTLYDLMGLRWSPYADDVNSMKLDSDKLIQQERRNELRVKLLETIHNNVNNHIGLGDSNQSSRQPVAEDIPPGSIENPTSPRLNPNNYETIPAPETTSYSKPNRLNLSDIGIQRVRISPSRSKKTSVANAIRLAGHEAPQTSTSARKTSTQSIRSPRRIPKLRLMENPFSRNEGRFQLPLIRPRLK